MYGKKDSDAAFTLLNETTDNTDSCYYFRKSMSINRLRVVLSDSFGTTVQVSQIGLVYPTSEGVSEVCLSRAGGSLYGSVYPYTTGAYNLGTSSKRWKGIYAQTLNLSGKATVGSVESSGAGAFGSLTAGGKAVATQEWVTGNGYMALAGAETVTGQKTFSVLQTLVQGAVFGGGSGAMATRSVTLRSPLQEYGGTNSYTVELPSAGGTLALKSDLNAYLPKTGGTLTGGLSLTTLAATEVTLGGVFRFYTSADSLRVEIGGSHFDVGLNLTPVSS